MAPLFASFGGNWGQGGDAFLFISEDTSLAAAVEWILFFAGFGGSGVQVAVWCACARVCVCVCMCIDVVHK